jgi:transposase
VPGCGQIWTQCPGQKRPEPELGNPRRRERKSTKIFRKALFRLNQRVHNKIDDMHKKLSTWLCDNYRVILIPEFKVQGMIDKKQCGVKAFKRLNAFSPPISRV